MTTATTAKTITLTDLAKAVNNLIETQPDRRNPQDAGDTLSCLYYDVGTGNRCLIGQALYDLTGRNVPAEFEDQSIGLLFLCDDFLRFFSLDLGDERMVGLEQAIVDAQGVADGRARWGVIDKVNV